MSVVGNEIGDLLVELGFLSQEQLSEAIIEQDKTHERLTIVLDRLGFVPESSLKDALELQFGVTYVKLATSRPDNELIRLVPEDVQRKYRFVPVAKHGNNYTVAMVDPDDLIAADAIRVYLHSGSFKKLVCTADDFEYLMQTTYDSQRGYDSNRSVGEGESSFGESSYQQGHESSYEESSYQQGSESSYEESSYQQGSDYEESGFQQESEPESAPVAEAKSKRTVSSLFGDDDDDDDLDDLFGEQSSTGVQSVQHHATLTAMEEQMSKGNTGPHGAIYVGTAFKSIFGSDDEDESVESTSSDYSQEAAGDEDYEITSKDEPYEELNFDDSLAPEPTAEGETFLSDLFDEGSELEPEQISGEFEELEQIPGELPEPDQISGDLDLEPVPVTKSSFSSAGSISKMFGSDDDEDDDFGFGAMEPTRSEPAEEPVSDQFSFDSAETGFESQETVFETAETTFATTESAFDSEGLPAHAVSDDEHEQYITQSTPTTPIFPAESGVFSTADDADALRKYMEIQEFANASAVPASDLAIDPSAYTPS
ncbi:MAG: hypothetical protein K2Z81_23285, partial [Cyanobacteria bacterium]|nr:hypothetical protein [Cyanobacteriota bacterium]